MEDTTRIVLGDAHLLFVEALTGVLRGAGYDVAGTAATLATLDAAIGAHQPPLALVESHFPDGATSDVLAGLTAAHPSCRFVILTADNDPDLLVSVLNDGAMGYVHKTRGLDTLLDALRRVAMGETVIEGTFVRPRRAAPAGASHVRKLAEFLTQRELECLTLLVAGLDTAAIAGRLGVSRTTVRSHVQAVLAKLGVHSRLEAASVAVRHGLVDSVPELHAWPVRRNA